MKISKKNLYLYSGIGIVAAGVAYFVYRAGKSSATTLKLNSASTGVNTGSQGSGGGSVVKPSQPAYQPQQQASQAASSGSLTAQEAMEIQSWLVKQKGYDLGKTGANKDGVDGAFGTMSKSAFERATGQTATTANLKKFAYELMNPVKGLVNTWASNLGFSNPFNGLSGMDNNMGWAYLESKL